MRDERVTRLLRCGLSGLLAILALTGLACGGPAEPAAPATGPAKTTYKCGVQVSKKSAGEFSGKGSAADAAVAEEAAWTDVCAKLPEAERPTCRDETKWQMTKSSMSGSGGGPVTHGVTIQLVAIAPSFAGEGTSESSSEEACKAALTDACAKAGAQGDCVAAGYEKKGEIINTKKAFGKR